jgi:hypothetical protein
MNSCITPEYADHEVLKVVKYTAEALQKTALGATRARIMPKKYGVLDHSLELGPPADFPVL